MKEQILDLYMKWLSEQPYPQELSKGAYAVDTAFTIFITTLDRQGY